MKPRQLADSCVTGKTISVEFRQRFTSPAAFLFPPAVTVSCDQVCTSLTHDNLCLHMRPSRMAPLLLVVLLLGASAVSAQLTPCSVSESSSRGTIVTSLGSQLSTLAGSSPFNATLSPVDDAGAPVLFSLSSDSSYTLTLTSDVLNARLVSLYTLTVLFWVSTASAATPLSLNVSVTDVEAPPMFAFSSLGLNVSTSASGVSVRSMPPAALLASCLPSLGPPAIFSIRS